MPDEMPSVGDLHRQAIIEDTEIAGVVDAYLADPKLTAYQFATGHTLNVRAAVKAHRPAKAIFRGEITSDARRRSMIRAAVLLAPVVGIEGAELSEERGPGVRLHNRPRRSSPAPLPQCSSHL